MPKRILVVDDNKYEVCDEAQDGIEAIEKALQQKPDLVLLDLGMPRMNGADAASVLKRKMPNVRVIIFTMYDKAVVRTLSAVVGADLVLSKSDGWGNLIESMETLLALQNPS